MPASTSFSPLLVALAAMLWGGDLLLRPSVLAAGWSPARVVFGEHLLLTLLFAGVLWRGRRTLAGLSRRQGAALLFVGWGGSALATWLYTRAFTLGAPLTAILLQKTQPVFALVLAWLVLGERRRTAFWAWCVAALAGAYLLTGITALPSLSDVRTQQALCALGAAALWGAATVAGRSLTPVLTPALLAGGRFAVALPVLVVLAAFSSGGHPVHDQATHAFLFLLLIVLLPDLTGMGLYYLGLRGTPASVATLAELWYPLTSLLIGIGFQHTHLALGQMLGLILLIVSVLLLGRQPAAVVSTPPAHEYQPAAVP